MRRLLRAAVAATLLLWAVPAQASFSLIAHTFKQGTNPTPSITTTGADLLVATVASFQAGSTLTDAVSGASCASPCNTWLPLTQYTDAANVQVRLYYVQGGTVGTGHTFTGSGSFVSIAVAAFSGSIASPFNAENGAGNASVSSLATGSVSPSGTDLFVSAVSCDNVTTAPTVSSFTITDASAFDGNGRCLGMAWKESASAQNETWTFSVSGETAVTLASFKGSGGGGATSHPCSSLRLLGVGCVQ